uniref:Putative HNH endonuclease n=1 Tax=viral metagenome TaxID=1070528 RepID=A0A6H1ZS24_9ZZZZ
MKDYKAQYLDPRWQKKRLEILNRDNFTCQMCSDKEKTLHIHHRRYISGRDIWDVPNELLVTFCAGCHETEKFEMEEYMPLLIEQLKDKFFGDDIRELAHGINSLRIKNKTSEEVAIIINKFLHTLEDI